MMKTVQSRQSSLSGDSDKTYSIHAMDFQAISWFSEQVLDDSIFTGQRDFLDSFDEDMAAMIRQDFENCLSGGNSSPSSSTLINDVSGKADRSLCGGTQPLQNPDSFSKFSTRKRVPDPDRSSSTPVILKFGNASSPENPQSRPLNPDEVVAISEILRSKAGPFADPDEAQLRRGQTKKTRQVRSASQTYDHIVAERKRRELLSQGFLALSTIIPGLKKMDKSSILGDAIKYLKQLQERVKTLEEQARKQTMESAVLFVKKSQVAAEDENSTDGESSSYDEHPLPEIEARVCNNHILLRVHCEKHKGVLVDLLSKVEKLNLAILHTNVATFGSLALDITIIADMEREFNLTVKEVVKRLRAALQR
ncbi:UNVERIFIED_CONTAM: Transcription factor [Sesamum radiatum]|uniref:Transcription factor n=1 Tax=Sesamum radiatum TaxID=300843 RepID=A0AAW2VQA0_SESRA